MRSRILGFLLLIFSSVIWGNENVKIFTDRLSDEDRFLLEKFFQAMVQSINGFVIYGDKPIGLLPYLNTTPYMPNGNGSDRIITLARGKDLWQNLNVSPYNKEYLLVTFNCNGYCNFAAINRKAFVKTVNNNLSLFRYVLGPTLTAEKLLQELIDAKDDFYSILKDDNALLGILLGYGTQNALLGSRIESICYSFASDQKEEFPFLPCMLRMEQAAQPKNQVKSPSLGFRTLSEEAKALVSRISSFHENPPLRHYELPYFGCELKSEETLDLLAIYKQNQTELLKAVEEPEFLEKTLTKFFTTTSGTVEIPSIPQTKEFSFVDSKEEVSEKLADLIALDVWSTEERCLELCIKSYLEGIEAQEKEGQDCTARTVIPNWKEAYDLNNDLSRYERLKKSNDYFKRISQSENHVCLIPNGIYYRVLRKGQGKSASSKIKNATFHYSYRILGEEKPRSYGTINQENLAHFIPGMIHVLIGMRKGEKRSVSIHPSYGYGDNSFLPPNSTLIAKVELLDFEEGDQEVAILPPYELQIKNIEGMQARYEELKSKEYYETGRTLWHEIKKIGNFIDLDILKKSLEILAKDRTFRFSSLEEACEYSIDLKRFFLFQKSEIEASRQETLCHTH